MTSHRSRLAAASTAATLSSSDAKDACTWVGRADSPQPGRSYLCTVRPRAKPSSKRRSAARAQLISRWLSHPPMNSRGGPSPAVAYANVVPSGRGGPRSAQARLRPMRGLKRHRSVRTVAAGHAFVQNLRRGHYDIATERPIHERLVAAFSELALCL